MSHTEVFHAESLHTEVLHTGQKLIQNDACFKFGIDAVLLADFSSKIIRNNDLVLDMGCGNGIIPILLAQTSRAQKITGVEIQNEVANLATENAKLNKLEEKISIINADIKDFQKLFTPCTFNDIVTNPPYMKNGSGKKSTSEALQIARCETKCTLSDIIECATYNLKSNGNFMMIHRPSRISEICVLLDKHNLGIKTIRFVCPKPHTEPTMVLIHAKKDFHPELKVEKDLIVSNEDGSYTEEVRKIYLDSCQGPNLPYKS